MEPPLRYLLFALASSIILPDDAASAVVAVALTLCVEVAALVALSPR